MTFGAVFQKNFWKRLWSQMFSKKLRLDMTFLSLQVKSVYNDHPLVCGLSWQVVKIVNIRNRTPPLWSLQADGRYSEVGHQHRFDCISFQTISLKPVQQLPVLIKKFNEKLFSHFSNCHQEKGFRLFLPFLVDYFFSLKSNCLFPSPRKKRYLIRQMANWQFVTFVEKMQFSK